MESLEEIKKLINEAKNICLIPQETTEPESLTAALALFYTLKELGKNVNLIIEKIPEKYHFLIPSLDFISSPKNFVISIPTNVANVSSVYYEKNDDSLKIHLTIDKGTIKKDNLSFYFSEAKPDLVITLGVQDFQKQLSGKLDAFGFLLNAPILNIDNNQSNKKFGAVNVLQDCALSEMLLEIISSINKNPITKETATCILADLIVYYNNFQNPKIPLTVFQLCADLMSKGADREQIIKNIYHQTATKSEPIPEVTNIAHTNIH